MIPLMQDISPARRPGATTQTASCWHDTAIHRLMLTALLNTLDNALLTTSSATRTLEEWSRAHHLAADPTVRAVRVASPERSCPAELLAALACSEKNETLRYRHVRLMCGDLVLSEAENWYIPSRLSPAMNTELETTDTPFGRVVAQLAFTRRLITAERLWAPLPDGWELTPLEAGNATPLTFPPLTLRHQAVLHTQPGVPFSAVIETYTSAAFQFPPPDLH